MALVKTILSGALWAVKSLVRVVLKLFCCGRDDDSDTPSSGLPRPYSGISEERRPLGQDPQRYHSYAGPRTAPTHRQSAVPSARVSVHRNPSTEGALYNFLPIYDRDDYEAARAEARRLLCLQTRSAKKWRGIALSEHREQLIESRQATINILNAEASEWIYRENNRPGRLPADSVDLHGLKVVEATEYAEMGIREAKERGKHRLRLIVGKGKHSEGGISVLKPAIKQELKLRGWRVDVDPRNAGVLVVRWGDRQSDMV